MAKKKEIDSENTENTVKLSNNMPTKKIEAPVLVTFDRWFALQGRPAHHKAGMSAYTNTKGKMTVDAWNKLFKNY